MHVVVYSNGCQLHERVYSGHSQTAFCPKSSTTPWDGFSALQIAVTNCCKVKSGKFYITSQYLSSLLSYLSLCVLLLVILLVRWCFFFFFFFGIWLIKREQLCLCSASLMNLNLRMKESKGESFLKAWMSIPAMDAIKLHNITTK